MNEQIIITAKDLSNLADIVWYIKGYAAVIGDYDINDFCKEHLTSLTKAVYICKKWKDREETNV